MKKSPLVLSFCATLAGCIGIPVSRQTEYHILATGWTVEGEAMAIAAVAHLGRVANPIPIDGPVLKWTRQFDGLVLITESGAKHVKVAMPKGFFYWGSAIARKDGNGFLILLQIPKNDLSESSFLCATVNIDGTVKSCVWPQGNSPPPYTSYFSENGYTIRVRRQVNLSNFWFESWDVRTGVTVHLEPEFLTYPLRHPTDPKPSVVPCEMDQSRLSPHEDQYAAISTMNTETGGKSGVWLISKESAPRLLIGFQKLIGSWSPDEKKSWKMQALEDVTDSYGIAWHPDQKFIYFCGGEQLTGLIVSVDGSVKQRNLLCFKHPAWSPEGDRIAGSVDEKLQFINVAAR